jgi:hypothetical protein
MQQPTTAYVRAFPPLLASSVQVQVLVVLQSAPPVGIQAAPCLNPMSSTD